MSKHSRQDRRAGARSGVRLAFWTLLVLTTGASAAAQAPDEGDKAVRSFAIPETSLARALYERAAEHVAAKRWSEAVLDLQTLIEEHSGEVLAGSTGGAAEGWRSQQPVHRGAAEAAERLLAELPEPGRRLYLERYGPLAQGALTRARLSGERDALARVARRYPLTQAAREAWWSLGDFEFELGQLEAARAAWQRAANATRAAGQELPAGARTRLELAFPAELEGATRPGGDGSPSTLAPPGADAQSWRVRVDESPSWYPFYPGYKGGGFNLMPVCARDMVLVSNSLRVFAFDAWTGRTVWKSDEAPGWEDVDRHLVKDDDGTELRRSDFFHAIDQTALLVAPAASERIVVSALQIPVTQVGNKRYQRIPITTVIPDRRLFAFDLETGAELWNHMPPPDWNGESGSFAERMRVAGPPIVAGSRVLVPTYRLQGRIEYHVACYDLASGGLLWSTAVISGQVALNMFGRQSREFAAAPLVVAGERVLALTQLGALAALDLYTGDILWETLYDSLPLPRNDYGLDTPRRPQFWNNSAPWVQDSVVLATPLDSTDLIAVDVESGAMLWSLSRRSLVGHRPPAETWTLIGADDQTVYLSGTSVLACRAPLGLAGTQPPSEIVFSPLLAPDVPPRAAFGERWIVAPTPTRRVVLDRFNLKVEDRLLSFDWSDEQETGNAYLFGGALFTLSGKYLTGTFDWRIQQRRFEDALERDPGDHNLALSYAGLLVDRAGTALHEANLPRALTNLRRAERELEPRLALESQEVRQRASASLYRALRIEAEVLSLQADSAGALERLQRARALTGTRLELRDTLLELARLHRARREETQRMQVLGELEQACGELVLPVGNQLFERSPGLEAPPGPHARSIALWVGLERAAAFADAKDIGAELGELHRVLGRWGDVALTDAPKSERVSERIADLIAEAGRAAYEPFEKQARAAYEQALAEDDGVLLERVVARFPHSQAAGLATRARRERAWRSGEPEVLARLVQEQLADDWSPALAGDEELEGLLQLGALLRSRGNLAFEAGLLRVLARGHPDLVLANPAGPSLAERARLAGQACALDPQRTPATFDASASQQLRLLGHHELLGRVPRRAAQDLDGEVLILAASEEQRSKTLVALSSQARMPRLWSRVIEQGRGPREGADSLITADAVVLVEARGLLGLDPADGAELWSHPFSSETVTALTGDSGVAVVSLESPERGARLMALDVRSGVPLWSFPVPRESHSAALVGGEHCVILPRQAAAAPALVLDLFVGRVQQRFTLEADVGEADRRGAWIDAGLLVLPSFPRGSGSRQTYCVLALDLLQGRSAWRVGPEPGRELDSIVRHGHDAYLVFFALPFAGSSPGALLQLDTRLGAVRPVPGVEPSVANAPIGVRRSAVIELDEPYLFLLGPAPGGSESVIRALHLPYGERWVQRLPLPPDEVYDSPPPLPAQTSTSVVLAFSDPDQVRTARGTTRTNLKVLDRASGVHRETRLLDDMGRADSLELVPFGPALLVFGRHALVILTKE